MLNYSQDGDDFVEEFVWQANGALPCGCQAEPIGVGSNNCTYQKICEEIFTGGINSINSASVVTQCVDRFRLNGYCVVSVGYRFTISYTDCCGRTRTRSASGFTMFFEESSGLCNYTVEVVNPPEVMVCGNRIILRSRVAICR